MEEEFRPPPAIPAAARPAPSRRFLLLALAPALLFFFQAFLAARHDSLTWDEPLFISAGCSYLAYHDFRLTREAPPLLLEAEALLPTLLLHPALPGKETAAWRQGDVRAFARSFIELNARQVERLALLARLPVQILGAAMIFLLACWGKRLYGSGPALGAATAAALCPNLLAHGSLATTDLGCAAFMLLAVAAFWSASRQPGALRWLLCGLATGLALLAKFTSMLLGPVFLVLGLVLCLRRRITPAVLALGCLLVLLTAAIVVGAGYNFTFNLGLYARGLREVFASGARAQPGYRFYLLGAVSDHPWWTYHLAAFVFKAPLPFLILLGWAAVAAVGDRSRREAALFLLVPAALVLAASAFDRTDLGIRRILPAYPFLFLFTGQALVVGRSRVRAAAAAVLLLALALGAAKIYPHHLSYFNEAAGGPERGPYLLDDSNIDWGQDLPALAAWRQAHPDADPFRLLYFGNVPPRIYGVEADSMGMGEITAPRAGTYAVSAHMLVYFRKLEDELGPQADWLTRFRPIDRAGYSIYLYRFDAAPPAAGGIGPGGTGPR